MKMYILRTGTEGFVQTTRHTGTEIASIHDAWLLFGGEGEFQVYDENWQPVNLYDIPEVGSFEITDDDLGELFDF